MKILKGTLILSSIILALSACSPQPAPEEQGRPQNAARVTLMAEDSEACRAQYNLMADTDLEALLAYSLNTESMKQTPDKGDTVAIMKTNRGELKILLYTDKVPETTKNFVELAKEGKYDETVFHRVIDCFMIQGGDFENSDGTGGYSYKGEGTKFDDEFGDGLKHIKGAISMANAGPNTNGSQFFIVQADRGTPHLDGMHSVFGYVYDGLDVVDEIGQTQTDNRDRPIDDVIVESVEITTFGE